MVKINNELLKELNIELKEDYAQLMFDLSIYDLESIYSAAYNLLEKAYFFFNEKESLIVTIFPKEKDELKELVLEFNNQIINYSFYKIKSLEHKSIKEIVLSKALFVGQDFPAENNEECAACSEGTMVENENIGDQSGNQREGDDDDLVDLDDLEDVDLEDIRVPWEEKMDADVLEKEREKLTKIYTDKNKEQ